MLVPIIVALITGGLSLIGTVLTVLASSHRTAAAMQVNQAVTDTKLEELTREVREHNDFGRRIPVIEEQIKVVNHRLTDLEQAVSKGVA